MRVDHEKSCCSNADALRSEATRAQESGRSSPVPARTGRQGPAAPRVEAISERESPPRGRTASPFPRRRPRPRGPDVHQGSRRASTGAAGRGVLWHTVGLQVQGLFSERRSRAGVSTRRWRGLPLARLLRSVELDAAPRCEEWARKGMPFSRTAFARPRSLSRGPCTGGQAEEICGK